MLFKLRSQPLTWTRSGESTGRADGQTDSTPPNANRFANPIFGVPIDKESFVNDWDLFSQREG